MSTTTSPTKRTSLKRKLADSDFGELELPNPKRQRLNDDNNNDKNETQNNIETETEHKHEHVHKEQESITSIPNNTENQSTKTVLVTNSNEMKNGTTHKDDNNHDDDNKDDLDLNMKVDEKNEHDKETKNDDVKDDDEEFKINHNEKENLTSPNKKRRKRLKRFVADSDSEDENDDDVNNNNNHDGGGIRSTKFILGDEIETVGNEIPETINDKNDEEEDDEDEDEDLAGFVVADDDIEEDIDESVYRRILIRNHDNDDQEDDFFHDIETNRITLTRRQNDEQDDDEDEEEDDIVIAINNNHNNHHNHNNHNYHGDGTRTRIVPITPTLEDEEEDEDEVEEDEEDEDDDAGRILLGRSDTNESMKPRLLRFHSEETQEDADDDDDDDMADLNDDDDMADLNDDDDDMADLNDHTNFIINDEDEDVDEEDIESISDGESLNSIDDEIDKEIYGTSNCTEKLTFANIVKRGSLPDMSTLFSEGFDIKRSSFWTDFAKFFKKFNKKAIKAHRLLSILHPLGFAHSQTKNELSDFNVYNPSLFTITKRTKSSNIDVTKILYSQNEYEFMKCIEEKKWDQIPKILLEGIHIHEINGGFFNMLKNWRMNVIQKWFERITFNDLEEIKKMHNIYGLPIDITIPRSLIKPILSTTFEHLEGSTGLIIASISNSLQIVKYLISQKCDIEYKTPFGSDTALMHASKRGNLEVVKYLCNVGANINTTTKEGECYTNTETPVIFETLLHKKTDIVEFLTYYGADLLLGPTNMNKEIVDTVRLCLNEGKYGMKQIKNGLKKRFDLTKKCLAKQFPSDIDIVNSIGRMICNEYLNPMSDEYINYLKQTYDIDTEDDEDLYCVG